MSLDDNPLIRPSATFSPEAGKKGHVSPPDERPPTLIVIHPRERRAKCTVRPLRGLPGFEFRRFPLKQPVPPGYVRLGLGGPVLSANDAECGLLVLDGTWRWAGRMEAQLADIPVRSL